MHSTGTRGYITTTIRAIPRAIPLNVQYHYIKICYGIMWLSRRQLSYQNKATSHSPQNLLRKLVRLLWLPVCQGNNGISLFSCFCSLLVIFCHCIKDTCKKADPNSWNGSKSNWISKEDHPWCCDRKFIQCSNHTAIRNNISHYGVFERPSLACTLCCLSLAHTMPSYMRSLLRQHLRMQWQTIGNCEYQRGFQVALSNDEMKVFSITHKLRARFSDPQSSTTNEKTASTGMLSRLL